MQPKIFYGSTSIVSLTVSFFILISIVIILPKPSLIHVNSSRFFADLRPFKSPALVVLMYFSQ